MPSITSYLLCGTLLAITPLVSAVIHPSIPLKTSHIMRYVGSQQELPWMSIGNNASLVNFSPEEWTIWENETRAHTNLTDETGAMIPDHLAQLTLAGQENGELDERSISSVFQKVACFGSGSYARAVTLGTILEITCAGFTLGATAGGTQVIKQTGLVNEAGNDMNVFVKLTIFTGQSATTGSCSGALSMVISDYCTGHNADTRGGTAKDSAGNEYTIDPTTLNCDC